MIFCSILLRKHIMQILFQLKKDFGDRVPDKFPPKKLLPLKQAQLEERREHLEKYLQAISQDPVLVASKIFVKFLLKAQKVCGISYTVDSQKIMNIKPKTFGQFVFCQSLALSILLQESNKVEEEDTHLDIYLMNGKKFQVNVRNTDSTDHVRQVPMFCKLVFCDTIAPFRT